MAIVTTPFRCWWLVRLSIGLSVLLLPEGSLPAEEARPPFEKLLALNSEAIFGGEVAIDGERITIRYKKPGQINRGFEGTGIVNPADLKGHIRKVVENPVAGGEIGELAVAGRDNGDWRSRFELSDGVKMTFRLRIPWFQKGSQLLINLNHTPKSSIQTSFFQEAVLVVGSQKKKRAAAPKEYQALPEKWFDKNALVNVSMACEQGKFTVKLKFKTKEKDKEVEKEVEMLSLDEAGDASGGRITVSFRKLGFSISDLALSGKFDRSWCESQLRDLETKGALALKEKPPPPAAIVPPARREKKAADEKAAREKDAEREL